MASHSGPARPLFQRADRKHAFAMLALCCCLNLAGAGQSIAWADAVKPIRIMPLGDSITEAASGSASYRFYLWQTLKGTGYPIAFVGSMQGVRGGTPLRSDFDQHHEGHSGWRADQVLERIASWAAAARPDIVLLHLGTNDLWQGQAVNETARDIAAVIDRLRTVNPHIRILLAQIIPSTLPPLREIATLNRELLTVARDRSTPGSPVLTVDLATGFDPAAMTSDGVHPNDPGERLMAERWAAALIPQLQAYGTPRIQP